MRQRKRDSDVERRSDCAICVVLDMLGDKWTLLVVRDLIFMKKRSYGEFLCSDEKIATNILAERLARLEAAGIVEKRRDPENLRKYTYTLTAKGADLIPILLEMIVWGMKHDPGAKAPIEVLTGLKKNRAKLITELRNGL